MSRQFINIDRNQPISLPDKLEDWLDEKSLARFIVELLEQLDLSAIENRYTGGGSPAYPPRMMLALLFYCYATGLFSSRKIEKATYELIPVLYITGGLHPDHDSINTFRQRFLVEIKSIFVMVLEIAYRMGIFRLGDVSIDGSKVKANASKHKAMSWGYANRLEKQLKEEIEQLLQRAEKDNQHDKTVIDIPAEITRREERLSRVETIQEEIKQRAEERYQQEKADYDAKIAEREEKAHQSGKKPRGAAPKEPSSEPRDKDQVSFTDPDSRIMPQSGGGFVQGYNAQVSVEIDSRLIVTEYISQHPNDKQEVEPQLQEFKKLPDDLGQVNRVALDNGYFSKDNVEKIVAEEIEPYMPSGRQTHNQKLEERLADAPDSPENPTPMEAMHYRMKTREGKQFYALRKSTVEPVFGVIKEVMGFRHFMLRSLEKVQGEWALVCLAYNLKRLCVLNS